ncbi:uncharacterized protein METZ01_LOCUS340881, partial [marine metagenome]
MLSPVLRSDPLRFFRRQWEDPPPVADDGLGQLRRDSDDQFRLDREASGEA